MIYIELLCCYLNSQEQPIGRRKQWRRVARHYDTLRKIFPLDRIHKAEKRNIEELLATVPFEAGSRALDVGTGTGASRELLPGTGRSFAVDSSYAMICQSANKGLPNLIVADAGHLPFRNGTFALVTAVGLLEYVDDDVQAVKELSRVAISPGFLLLTFSQRTPLNFIRKILTDLRLVARKQVFELMTESGLTVLRTATSSLQMQFLVKRSEETRCD